MRSTPTKTKSWKYILDEVWLLVVLLIPTAGVVLWLLQKTWSIISEEREMKFSSAFFCSLSILLGDQSPPGPSHVTARVSPFQTISTMKIRGGIQTVLFGILIFSHSSAGFLYNACLYWSSKCKLCSFICPFLHSNLSFFLFLLSVNIYLINISACNSYKKPTCIKISYSRLYLQIYL